MEELWNIWMSFEMDVFCKCKLHNLLQVMIFDAQNFKGFSGIYN